MEEALRTCEEIEKRLGALTGNEKIEVYMAASIRGYMRAWNVALLVQEKYRDAMDAFCSAYAAFPERRFVRLTTK